MISALPERTALITKIAVRFCLQSGWSPMREMPLANGRRADVIALCPDDRIVCIEVKSSPRDFLSDGKWHEYRDYADQLYFAVAVDFPLDLLPSDVGVVVTDGEAAEAIRLAPLHPISAARRRAMVRDFARLAARRLAFHLDPEAEAEVKNALRFE